MGTTSYLYSINEKHWYKLQIDESGHYQWFFYSIPDKSSEAETQNSGDWQSAEFSSELMVWESGLGRVNLYFMHEGVLHRYYQRFNIIPKKLFVEVGEHEEIDEDKERKIKDFNTLLNKHNGFEFTDENGIRDACGQFIQKVEGGKWTDVKNVDFSNFAALDFINHHQPFIRNCLLPYLPKDVSRDVSSDWFRLSKQKLEIREAARVELNKLNVLLVITKQLDEIVLELLSFKKLTSSKAEYLLLLELLLGKSEIPEELRAKPLLLHVARLRVTLRKPNLSFHKELYVDFLLKEFIKGDQTLTGESIKANAVEIVNSGSNADSISKYLLTLIEIEYENIAGHSWPDPIDVTQLPQLEGENTREHDRMYELFSRLVEFSAEVTIDDFMEIAHRLGDRSHTFPVNEYNLVTYWLLMIFTSSSMALEHILRKNLCPNKLELFASTHRDFVMALTDRADLLTDNLLCDLAAVSNEFALAVLDRPGLLNRMPDDQKAFVSVLYPEFAKRVNFTADKVLQHLSPLEIATRALIHTSFSMALLRPENEKIAKMLSPDDVMEIAAGQRNFALAVLSHPLRSKVKLEELYEQYEFLEWDYLSQHMELRDLSVEENKRLQIVNLTRAARIDVNAARAFIRNPEEVWVNRARVIAGVAESFPEELTAEISREPEILNNLVIHFIHRDSALLKKSLVYLIPFMKPPIDFVSIFRVRPELITTFASSTLWMIALTDSDFAFYLLEHPQQLQQMLGDQLDFVIRTNSSFAQVFYQQMTFDDYSEDWKRSIIRVYAALAKTNDEFAYKFFRKREFLPHLSLLSDNFAISDIIAGNPGLALRLLLDTSNYLDELEEIHLSGSSDVEMSDVVENNQEPALAWLLDTSNGLEKQKKIRFLEWSKFKVAAYPLIDKYLQFAKANIDIALAWLNRPGFLRYFDHVLMIKIAKKHDKFALELVKHPTLLQDLLNKDPEFVEKAYDIIAPELISKPEFLIKLGCAALKLMTDLVDRRIKSCSEKRISLLTSSSNNHNLESFDTKIEKAYDFRYEILQSPKILSKLDKDQLFALFGNTNEELACKMPGYEDFEISNQKHNKGEVIIKRKIQGEVNGRNEDDLLSFHELKTNVCTKLIAYNLFTYVNKPETVGLSGNTFSETCLSAVSNSNNKNDLQRVLKEELIRLKGTQTFYARHFSYTPDFVTLLKIQVKQVVNYIEKNSDYTSRLENSVGMDMANTK